MPELDHLLRTLAAVAPQTRVLDVECGEGHRLVPLAQLGFAAAASSRDAQALGVVQERLGQHGLSAQLALADAGHLPFDDDAFDWVVAWRTLDGYSDAERLALLAEWRRVLAPGGWLYLAAPAHTTAEALTSLAERGGFSVAEAARVDPGAAVTRGIFRRVETGTVS